MSKALTEWATLAKAAIHARDDLRVLAADLSIAMASGSVPRALTVRARDTARRHADGLRLALKHPAQPKAQRADRDLPCWTETEGSRR